MNMFSFFKRKKSGINDYPVKTNINKLSEAFNKYSEEYSILNLNTDEYKALLDENLIMLITPNSSGLKDSYSGIDYYCISLSAKDGTLYFINSYSNNSFPENNKNSIVRITYQTLYEIAQSLGNDCYGLISQINEGNWQEKFNVEFNSPSAKQETAVSTDNSIIRIPIEETELDCYRCPCGRSGIIRYKTYSTTLDDADIGWGDYDESFSIALDDPCNNKYSIISVDEKNNEFVLRINE